jgi:HEAT repeat protein
MSGMEQVMLAYRLFGSVSVALTLLLLTGCAKTQPTHAGGQTVEHWVQELKNPDPKARKHAVAKLGNVGTSDSAALPGIVYALNDQDGSVRLEAIVAITKFTPAPREVIPTLSQMQKNDRDARVREYAGKALEKLQR